MTKFDKHQLDNLLNAAKAYSQRHKNNYETLEAHKQKIAEASKAGGEVLAELKDERDWASEKDGVLTLFLFGTFSQFEWSWDDTNIPAKKMAERIDAFKGDEIVCKINSGGGSYFEGAMLFVALEGAKERGIAVKSHNYGIVGSAATLPYFAATEREQQKGSIFFMHRAWGVCIGNSKEMKAEAEGLEVIDGELAAIYADKLGLTEAGALEIMDEDKMIGSKEAVDLGIATKQTEGKTDEKGEKNNSTTAIDKRAKLGRLATAALKAASLDKMKQEQKQ